MERWKKTSISCFAGLQFTRVILTLLLALPGTLALTTPLARAQSATCTPMIQGYWKNHTNAWFSKVTGLTLGTTLYTNTQLLQILNTPPNGDASLILAHQLIAALLNVQVIHTDPTPISGTITDANTALGSGPIPENIPPPTTLGQEMVNDATTLDSFNNSQLTTACAATTPPPASCAASSSLTVLATGSNVVAYVPKGSWQSAVTGVSVVNVEGTSITPGVQPTANAVNSCASDPTTSPPKTVCTANNTDVYVIPAGSPPVTAATFTSGATTEFGFSGGNCANCGVAMDTIKHRAAIAMGVNPLFGGGFQFLNGLDTATPSLGSVFASQAPLGPSSTANISEDILIDPVQQLILSPNELSNYELVDVSTTMPAFFENPISSTPGIPALDSAGEDCSTKVALALAENKQPSQVFLANLSGRTTISGTPGSWTAPSQIQSLGESALSSGGGGIAIAQGTHTGVLTGEFGGSAITAIKLPAGPLSSTTVPAISDWVTCNIPDDPSGAPWNMGMDPHTVTAYQTPSSSGDAIAVVANSPPSPPPPTFLAVIDLTEMLNPSCVARDTAGQACSAGTLPSCAVRFVPVP